MKTTAAILLGRGGGGELLVVFAAVAPTGLALVIESVKSERPSQSHHYLGAIAARRRGMWRMWTARASQRLSLWRRQRHGDAASVRRPGRAGSTRRSRRTARGKRQTSLRAPCSILADRDARLGERSAPQRRGITIPGNIVVGVYRNDFAVRMPRARDEYSGEHGIHVMSVVGHDRTTCTH